MGIFGLLAIGAGFARNGITLDVLNGALGLCGAASVPPAVGTLGHIYSRPSKRKNLVFACFSAGNPIGFVLGSVCSGIATKILSWRASYWALAIIFLSFTVVAFFSVPKTNELIAGFTWEMVNRFDCLGALLTVAGFAMVSSSLS
jgi:MFS family permease